MAIFVHGLIIYKLSYNYLIYVYDYYKLQIFLYGSDNYNPSVNKIIISFVIDFIIQSKRFKDPLIQK